MTYRSFWAVPMAVTLLAVGCAGNRVSYIAPDTDSGVAEVIPSVGRVVGFLEYVDVNVVPQINGIDVDPSLSEITVEGPNGHVACRIYDKESNVQWWSAIMEGDEDVKVVGRRLKAVPAGTKLGVKPTSRKGHDITVHFTGTSVAVEVINGPDGRTYDWTIDDTHTGRFDLYMPTKWSGYGRFEAFMDRQLLVTGLPDGDHVLKMSLGEPNPDFKTPSPDLHTDVWMGSLLRNFYVSQLVPGKYQVTVVAHSADGKELGRQQTHFYLDPELATGLNAYVHSSGYGNIFEEGASPRWTVTASNTTDKAHSVEPVIELTDFWGNTQQLSADARPVEPGQTQAWDISWPKPESGWYLCRMIARTGNKILTIREQTASIVPKAKERVLGSTPMEVAFNRGINGVLEETPEQLWRLYQLAGIEGDHFALKPTSENLEKAAKFNVQPGLGRGGGGYTTRDWTDVPKAVKITREHPDKHARKYVKGWRHHKDDEANTFAPTSYQNVSAGQRISARAMHQFDPKAELTPTQVGAYPDLNLYFEMYMQGAWPDVHYLNTHVYFQDPEWLLDGLNLYDWMQRKIPPRPMILGLWNTVVSSASNPVSPYPFDDRFVRVMYDQSIRGFHQRRYIRRYPWIEQQWHWTVYDYFECPHHAILFWNKTPKPIYNMIATMTWKLNGSKYVGPLNLGDQAKADVFERNGKAIITLWSDEPCRVTLDGVTGLAQVTDLMGRSRTASSNTFDVGVEAIYIEPKDAAYLKQAAAMAEKLKDEQAYWNDHAIVVVEGPGRGPWREMLLRAGEKKELRIWVTNEGDRPVAGRMTLARDTREGFWYGGVLDILGGEDKDPRWGGGGYLKDFTFDAQPFEIQPGEQAPVTFTIGVRPKIKSRIVTLRTKTYIQVGQQEVFLDPTSINMIVMAHPAHDPK